jgi:hypothetical protein
MEADGLEARRSALLIDVVDLRFLRQRDNYLWRGWDATKLTTERSLGFIRPLETLATI